MQKIARNAFFQFLTNSVLLGSSFIITTIIARTTSVDTLGRYSLIMTFSTQFIFLSSLGLDILLIRNIARDKPNTSQLFTSSLFIIAISSTITVILMWGVANILRYPQELIQQIAIISIWMILGVIQAMFMGVFEAHEIMHYETTIILLEKLITLFTIVIYFQYNNSLNGLLWILVISRFLSTFVSVTLFWHLGYRLVRFDTSLIRFLTLTSLPFALNIFLSNIYLQSDVVLLYWFRGDQDIGFYKAATTFFMPLSIIATSLNRALFPVLSRSHINEKNKLIFAFSKSYQYLFAIGIPLGTILIFIAPHIINIAFGDAYNPSIPSLQILALAIPLRFVNNTLGVSLTSTDHQNLRTKAIAVGTFLNISMNLFVLKRWGFIGASIMTVITEITIFLVLQLFTSSRIHRISFIRSTWRNFLSALLIPLVFLFFGGRYWWIALGLSPIIYILALYFFGGISKQDIQIITTIVRETTHQRTVN